MLEGPDEKLDTVAEASRSASPLDLKEGPLYSKRISLVRLPPSLIRASRRRGVIGRRPWGASPPAKPFLAALGPPSPT